MGPEITEEEWQEAKSLSEEFAPAVLPVGWSKASIPIDHPLYGMQVFENRGQGLTVLLTACRQHGDRKLWLHVSLSRRSRMPSYDDMKLVKEIFVGRDRQALQIFPPESEHVNIHNFCLHLWCAIGGDGLPNFGKYGTI